MYKLLCFWSLLLSLYATAQISPGNAVDDFSLKSVDGKYISLASLGEVSGAVLVFTSNYCQYSKAYEDRLNEIHQKYAAKGFPVVAINPSDPKAEPEESYEKMKKRAAEKKYSFYYLQDPEQRVAKSYDIREIPYVFLLQRYNGGNWGVEYVGAIDANPRNSNIPKERYLETAIQQLQDSTEVNPTATKVAGCEVKWRKN